MTRTEANNMEMIQKSFLFANTRKISQPIQIRVTQDLLEKNGEILAIPMTSHGTGSMGHVWPYV